MTPLCPVCGKPLGTGEPIVMLEDDDYGFVHVHEHCADPHDAETAISNGSYDPGEDYPHGAY